MRCYHLCNMYLSSIQQGVQSAHAQMELFVKYRDISRTSTAMLYEWAKNHKTMIVLNGGFLYDMEESLDFFERNRSFYPFASFYESKEALGGILTNIAIVLPEKIYKTSELIRNRVLDSDLQPTENSLEEDLELFRSFGPFTKFEIELCSFMNQFRLAI